MPMCVVDLHVENRVPDGRRDRATPDHPWIFPPAGPRPNACRSVGLRSRLNEPAMRPACTAEARRRQGTSASSFSSAMFTRKNVPPFPPVPPVYALK